MAVNTLNVGSYKTVVASGNIKAAPGTLLGIFCASGTAPTITVYDDAAAGTTIKIVDTFTPVPAMWYPMPFAFVNGLNIVVGGTASLTVALV